MHAFFYGSLTSVGVAQIHSNNYSKRGTYQSHTLVLQNTEHQGLYTSIVTTTQPQIYPDYPARYAESSTMKGAHIHIADMLMYIWHVGSHPKTQCPWNQRGGCKVEHLFCQAFKPYYINKGRPHNHVDYRINNYSYVGMIIFPVPYWFIVCSKFLHSKIEKLYVLNAIELIPSIWGYC